MWVTIMLLCVCIWLYMRLKCAESSLEYTDEQLEIARNDCQMLWEENQILKARKNHDIPR